MEIGSISNCLKYSKQLINIMRNYNELKYSPPILYHALVIPCSRFDKKWYSAYFGDHFMDISQRIGSFWLQGMKSKHDPLPIKDRYWTQDVSFHVHARNDLIKMMSVAIKGHYFLFKRDVLSEPPSIFPIPDFNNIDIPRYGLVYPFASSQHALVVSSIELDTISSSTLGLVKFPVVISKHSENWINLEHWKKLEKNGDELKELLHNKKDNSEIHLHTNTENFPYGDILDIPSPLVSKMRNTGIRWAEGIQKWYLPKGFDLAPVQEYLTYLTYQMREEEMNNLFG